MKPIETPSDKIGVSILVPNLNCAPFLVARFDSILAQSHPTYEVVVLDGFSTDGSWEIIQSYARRDPRIRAVQAPARGIYAAWNELLALARYEWIHIATSDDTIAPDALRTWLRVSSEKTECRCFISRDWTIDENGCDITSQDRETQRRTITGPTTRSGLCKPRRELLYAAWWGTPFLSITQFFIHREAFRITGQFPTDLGPIGDLQWQLKLIRNVPTYYVAQKLGSWRIHSTQSTTADTKQRRENHMRIVLSAWHDQILPHTCCIGLAVGYNTFCYLPDGLPGATGWARVGVQLAKIFKKRGQWWARHRLARISRALA